MLIAELRLALRDALSDLDTPPVRVVVGSWDGHTRGDERVVVVGLPDAQAMIDAVESAAQGYVSEDAPIARIVDTVLSVAHGRAVIPDDMLGALLGHVVRRQRAARQTDALLDALTPREREVFMVAATGVDKHEIGRLLHISPETARTHLARVMSKLAVSSRAELVARAAALGIDTGYDRSSDERR